jgi:mannosyl-oligosaccharide alpha-1,2-mannosidase
MLPTHRSSPSESEPKLSSKRPACFLNKLLIRWTALTCIIISFIWLVRPLVADFLSHGQVEFDYPSDISSLPPPSDSLDTSSTTTINQLRPPLNTPSQPTKEEQDFWELKKKEVRDAFNHAWSGYRNMAYPNDELMSLSGGKSNKFVLYSPTFPIFFIDFL